MHKPHAKTVNADLMYKLLLCDILKHTRAGYRLWLQFTGIVTSTTQVRINSYSGSDSFVAKLTSQYTFVMYPYSKIVVTQDQEFASFHLMDAYSIMQFCLLQVQSPTDCQKQMPCANVAAKSRKCMTNRYIPETNIPELFLGVYHLHC